jgi:hypothetical protein
LSLLISGGGFTVRGLYEHGTRDFDSYNPVEAEEHLYLEEGRQGRPKGLDGRGAAGAR